MLEPSGTAPLAIELAEAIGNGEVEVLYQPIVDLAAEDKVVSVEALVRWTPSSRPDVSTAEVVRAAEESGLIAEVDHYVLRRACLDAHTLQGARPGDPLTVNVNLSGLELASPGYVDEVENVLRDTGWPPAQLVLEVTESVLDVDTPAAIGALHALRHLGIRIVVDDFGTGYSSLSRIQDLPTDLVKIDRSFIETITEESQTPPLPRAISMLGLALDLPVIAEGVEDTCQAAAVTQLGYPLAQGFYYGRPQTCEAMLATLAERVFG